MKTSQINVEIEPGLRERVKVRAAQESKSMREVVENALRLYLSSPVLKAGGGSVGREGTGEAAAAAERGATDPMYGIPAAIEHDVVGPHMQSLAQPRPSKAELQALIDAVPAHRDRTTREVTVSADPLRGDGNFARDVVVSPREQERRRRAAQDRLRTSPEDASQDDEEGPGF